MSRLRPLVSWMCLTLGLSMLVCSVILAPTQVARADDSNSRANETANETTGETAAPVIRVTIGRIDVRAVNASAPQARRAMPAAPKLSLEEYLRSRSGRK